MKLQVTDPQAYEAFQADAEAAPVAETAAEALPPEAEAQGDAPAPIAVFVTHGMGQQLKFETLDQVANGLEEALRPERGEPTVSARTVTVGDARMERLEMVFDGAQAGPDAPPLALHLYEGYWAPLTEGNVTLRDVMRFLWTGAWNGLRKGIGRPLERFVFNRTVGFDVPRSTFWGLALTAVVLTALVVLNTVIGLVALGSVTGVVGTEDAVVVSGERAFRVGRPPAAGDEASDHGGFPSKAAVAALTGLVSLYLAVTLLFGIPLGLAAARRKERNRTGAVWNAVNDVLWTFLWIWCLATVLAGALAAVILGADTRLGTFLAPLARWETFVLLPTLAVAAGRVALDLARRARALRRAEAAADVNAGARAGAAALLAERVFVGLFVLSALALVLGAIGWEAAGRPLDQLAGAFDGRFTLPGVQTVVWGLLFAVFVRIRSLLVQYLGDVAAYVSSFKLDRFHELRKAIKGIVCDDLAAVYRLSTGGRLRYDHVLLVGHSLGSVVTYDAINRLLNDDGMRCDDQRLDVAGRTKLLLTFGSPLDKTAYVFRGQNKTLSQARETLAASVQPLIRDYDQFRTFPWVNVYSPRDIIGGRLDLYDLPRVKATGEDPAVRDVEDPEARIPLVAHVEHWDTRIVFDMLAERVEQLVAAGPVTARRE